MMNLLYKLYFALPNFAPLGIFGKAINRVFSFTIKRIFDAAVPGHLKRTADKAEYGLNREPREKKYIVSLTSFPARIDDVWICIETILRQSFKPDKIVLWLAEGQFPDRKLPESLTQLQERGLTIEFCAEDLRAHKKYFYALKQYPDDCIITLDDDLYYDKHLLRNVVNLHLKYPTMVATNRAHKMVFHQGKLKPYRKWRHNVTDLKPSMLLVPTGGAGTLYPPGVLHREVLNKNVFMEKCAFADDLWLKVMSLKNNRLVITNKKYNRDPISVASSQKVKLVTNNVFGGGNDEQLKNILEHYQIDLKNGI